MEEARLARATACYATLARQLASVRWRRHLRQHPHPLREALSLEVVLPEGPAGRRPRRLRTRLERLARRRLSRFTRQPAESLGDVLGRLEALVHAPLPQLPDASEPVLLHGHQGWRHFLSWPGSWVFLLLILTNRVGLERLGRPGPLLLVGGALCLYFHLRCSGRFWLTPHRLLWQPRYGEPVQVSLDSLSSDSISSLPAWGEVRVHGDRSFTVSHAGLAGRLAELLKHHLQPSFRERVEHAPSEEAVVVVRPAARR